MFRKGVRHVRFFKIEKKQSFAGRRLLKETPTILRGQELAKTELGWLFLVLRSIIMPHQVKFQ